MVVFPDDKDTSGRYGTYNFLVFLNIQNFNLVSVFAWMPKGIAAVIIS